MYHESDFGMPCTWHFFATSHGKSACDGIGAVIKYQARRASLQRMSENFITNAKELFTFAKENINGINILWYDEQDIAKYNPGQQSRFENAPPVGGSRSHHCFLREGSNLVGRRISAGPNSIQIHYRQFNNASGHQASGITISSLKPGVHIAYAYEDQWYLGAVTETSDEHEDVKVNSLHPQGPATSFKYPERRDELWVPLANVLACVELSTDNHRLYRLEQQTQEQVGKL